MNQEDIEDAIRGDIKTDIYGDLYGVDRLAEWFLYHIEIRDRRIKELEEKISNLSWEVNPDRMGGQFTDQEILDSQSW